MTHPTVILKHKEPGLTFTQWEDNQIALTLSPELFQDFQTLLKRATSTWIDKPPAFSNLSDLVMFGKILRPGS